MKYEVHTSTGLVASGLTLKEAADMVKLDPGEIEWCIQEYGVADTDVHMVVESGDDPRNFVYVIRGSRS